MISTYIIYNKVYNASKACEPHTLFTLLAVLLIAALPATAQIQIGGNVYGGGNAGDTDGGTKVEIYAGDLHGNVFGGARQANVGGSAFVHIDGEHASNYIVINKVFGGNDIAGTIGTSTSLPSELTKAATNSINNSWNAFVRLSSKLKGDGSVHEDNQKICIGQLFGGGNGDYFYQQVGDDHYIYSSESAFLADQAAGVYDDYIIKNATGFIQPNLGKTYLEVLGASISYAYGGGNNATITENTVIHVENPSEVVTSITDANIPVGGTVGTGHELLTEARFEEMGVFSVFSRADVNEYQVARFFGGNNVADMHIRPHWNLKAGKIRDLYSGGNRGRMLSERGLLLDIPVGSTLEADNVYGGCRMADVRPQRYNDETGEYEDVAHVYNLDDYNFPAEFAARTLIRGGRINNVYGGNDVRGKVYFGNAVGIYTTVYGNVYGGGNGSYPYTDSPHLANNTFYNDFYYDPDQVLTENGVSTAGLTAQQKSVKALNLVRPNAEQVSLRIYSPNPAKPTIVQGQLYCGGNSATLKIDPARKADKAKYPNYPIVELKIGSNAIINDAFLGNNGSYMVNNTKEDEHVLKLYTQTTYPKSEGYHRYTNLDLTQEAIMTEYMDGCAMDILPRVVFDNTENGDPANYEDYSTSIGSFYGGGNVGSMTLADSTFLSFTGKVIIFDKVVGGCNQAHVSEKAGINAEYNGGIIGTLAERSQWPDGLFRDASGNIKNRVVMNFSNLKLQPKRWKKDLFVAVPNGTTLVTDWIYYKYDAETHIYNYYIAEGTEVATGSDFFNLNVDGGGDMLEWNTIDSRYYYPAKKAYREVAAVTSGTGIATADDVARRFFGGHIYGGCYENGIVNGNVIININNSIIDRELLFDNVAEDGEGEAIMYDKDSYTITTRHTGVILDEQGMDVLGQGLNVFGGGKGAGTEIWGSTVVNLNGGYTFQIFGGSEEGVIGKGETYAGPLKSDYQWDGTNYYFNGKRYTKDTRFSCYVNLCGTKAGVSKRSDSSEEMAECEFMYGGSFFGPVCGNTVINLGNGRIFNSFASCNGDILGTARTYIGRQTKKEYSIWRPAGVVEQNVFEPGFPWVRDIIYGANDLGGRILGEDSFQGQLRGARLWDTTDFDVLGKVHDHDGDGDGVPDVLMGGAYVEYLQGRIDAIFAGCYGTYDYTDRKFEHYTDSDGEPLNFDATSDPLFYKPRVNNAIVNFRPTYINSNNVVKKVFGAGQGQPGETDRDKLQNRSYVLIDIPQTDDFNKYELMEVFGAGSWGGVGFDISKETYADDKDKGSAIIDLLRGSIKEVYGGSYEEGATRRTVVNVPEGATIKVQDIYGGAYGTHVLPPCDVYESYVNYNSDDATVSQAIYGGNNNERRTLYAHVNINAPVWSNKDKGYTATVYGAGNGIDTWAEYTEVNLNEGASVYEVYGGGRMGHVLNAESLQKYMQIYAPSGLNKPSMEIATKDPNWSKAERWNDGAVGTGTIKSEWQAQWAKDWKDTWTFGDYFTPNATYNNYTTTPEVTLDNTLVRTAEMDDRDTKTYKYNTNVLIRPGASVAGYAYGGGLGDTKVSLSGDVYGTTYIALLGGEVKKDMYAAGTAGSITNLFGADNFTASASAYVQGGTVRNVYGGGWRGSVGLHTGAISNVDSNGSDIFGESHVVIGKEDGTTHQNGLPSITRNAYGGGEGGAIFGTAYLRFNNGYIGYRYKGSDGSLTASPSDYAEELDDEKEGDNLLYNSGNIFGGGYVANSYVDNSEVKMYGGIVRGSIYGGGEIGPIGRGTVHPDSIATAGSVTNGPEGIAKIFKAGSTNVEMYDGHVLRNVFGGGRGFDNWGGEGWMTEEEKLTMDRSSKGYVFGQTKVNIHGGEIGTDEGMAEGFGNVFGGCDVGFVYSAYNVNKSTLGIGKKNGIRYDDGKEGYYYKYENRAYLLDDTEMVPTEDIKVVIGPNCRVTDAGGITFTGIFYPKKTNIPALDLDYIKAHPEKVTSGSYDANGIVTADLTFNRDYNKGEYISTYALHTLKDKTTDAAKWAKVDDRGIIVHNAVFAGGNVSSGATQVYANATTVYGNATASIHDVYSRDLITIGTGHTGGLYGEGNLTFVDGYRGLNITNYGTDYYNISQEITYSTYESLPKREQAYYELRYVCIQECTDNDGKTYRPKVGDLQASVLTGDELQLRFEGTSMILSDGSPNTAYWQVNGVCSRYAGRIMNTIQRADFCGVFGSRMVMQGARDRVPEIVDYTNYTINRVREVSLNKKTTVNGLTEPKHATHGNYFGIYNNVNFLGALTSDVNFSDTRTTAQTSDELKADGKTFYQWKEAHKTDRRRNRGESHNEVALASGVYLELTTEKSTGKDVYQKDWGYITGIITLDLINVQTGLGGGFVYAKNVHGVPTKDPKKHATLTALNATAVTRRDFTYVEPTNIPDPTNQKLWQTSGNFIHDSQTIIDDCFPESNRYDGEHRVPAHYWYIKGSVYVYDQYISAYTGSPNAYSREVNIPLVITAAAHGSMRLMDIKTNRYAYYAHNVYGGSSQKLGPDDVLELNNKTYKLNDPITYWDYNLLTTGEKRLFVDKTYITIAECTTGGKTYPAGTVLLPSEYENLRRVAPTTTIDGVPNVKYVSSKGENVAFDFIFRESNNLSHDTGYILTYDVNNPTKWDKWYTPITGSSSDDKITKSEYNALSSSDKNAYHYSPTYRPITAGLYGQHSYQKADIIPSTTYNNYQTLATNHSAEIAASGKTQAAFAPAYVVTKTLSVGTIAGKTAHLYPGATVVESDYEPSTWTAMSSSITPAYVCTSTFELAGGQLLTANTVLTETEKNTYKTNNPTLAEDIEAAVKPAYYCTTDGHYGGDYYETTKNYRGLSTWSTMSAEDRENFIFNYDALDVLIDPTYSRNDGEKYQYDGDGFTTAAEAEGNKAQYSISQPVDYNATYTGAVALNYTDKNSVAHTINVNDELTREAYEALPNEKRHYSAIVVNEPGTFYVANQYFIHGDAPYATGQLLSAEAYSSLSTEEERKCVTRFDIASTGTYFYCRESYTVGHNGEGVAVKNIMDGKKSNGSNVGLEVDKEYDTGDIVPVGIIIDQDNYDDLQNKQTNFTIHGIAPVETSTLYVSRESDIYDLSKEKIITVIYEYDYEEADETGLHITPISERHVVNIHITFESGVPTVEDIQAPKIVLPGTLVNLRTPHVTPGAYEVTGGGWMLFEKEGDTDSHTNGIDYTPTADPLYWYQHNYWVAYYAQTYLGRTFSNAVQVSVANYHDLAEVMSETNKEHHMYIDNPDVDREPKIYITTPDGLTNLKALYDLSLLNSTNVETDENGIITYYKSTTDDHPFKGHALLNSQVQAADGLEFFLRTDLDQEGTWTPIGASECFAGTVHGDGHYISGLDHSLFSELCGNVYNLGVRGSFTGGGIADTGRGYIENCWINTTGTPDGTAYAIMGNPTADAGTKQIVNSYCQTGKTYKTSATTHGMAIAKPDQAFYNGEVAYNLNGFYLYKRYNDNVTPSGSAYSYWLPGNDTPQTSKYPSNPDLCSSGYIYAEKPILYVEERFGDGDFIYSGGTIPDEEDERLYVDGEGHRNYYPIWPNDYIFFGQALNYGHMDGLNGRDLRTPQEWPSAINKNGNDILDDLNGNRVYRAPAYFRSGDMKMAHFNQYAVFAQSKNGRPDTLAYKDMTAIDFTGTNESTYQLGYRSTAPYASIDGGAFYPPLLDDDGLKDFYNADLTSNLLAYTYNASSGTEAGMATAIAVSKAMPDEAYVETHPTYKTVETWDRFAGSIRGHWVEKNGDNFIAPNDHMLVDRQDFNAPHAYRMGTGKRMWYQREPNNFVDRTKGWETISLPFTAEIVTTNQKGELTHFYSESTKSDNNTPVGHEYWLRQFTGLTVEDDEATANFLYPTSTDSDLLKEVTNTFLWDYFYNATEGHNLEDKNADKYQTYYSSTREYQKYPRLTAAQPYLIGFPGVTYYEFDLSGNFEALTTAEPNPAIVGKQTITFASLPGTSIGKSDDEMAGVVQADAPFTFTFKPSYLNMSHTADAGNYVLDALDGDAYNEVTGTPATTEAFRPYFTAAKAGSVKEQPRIILFSQQAPTIKEREEQDRSGDDDYNPSIDIQVNNHRIAVTSHHREDIVVRIFSTNGVLVANLRIAPEQTEETQPLAAGIYIVNRKKVMVK